MGQAPLSGVAWTAPTVTQWLWLGITALAIISLAITVALVVTLLLPPFDEQISNPRPLRAPALPPVAPLLESAPPAFAPQPPRSLDTARVPLRSDELPVASVTPLDVPLATPALTHHLLFARWLVEHHRLSG